MTAARPSLRALFFDVDDTLFRTTDFAQEARRQAVEAMCARGLRTPPDEVLEVLAQVVAEFGSNDDHHFDRVLVRLGPEATRGTNLDLLVVAGVIAYHETKWRRLRIDPAARDLLRDLAGTDLRLGIVSAGLARKQMEKILRLGLDEFVDPALVFVTDRVGIAKSNPLLYRRAAEAAGARPAEAMHVGDHPEHDVTSAGAAGLRTVWHRAGRHAENVPSRVPDHEIAAFPELRTILREHYGIPV